jgi:5-aminopentanamidase
MRLAVLQSPSPGGDFDLALAHLEAALHAAKAAQADALVAPEVFLPGYNHAHLVACALPDGAPFLRRLSEAVARAGTALVVGYAEAQGDRIYNSALCLGPDGREVARYRKIQLFGPREHEIYTPGDSYVTFNLAGTKAAILICYDVEFAPHIAALSAMGVGVILVPTANMAPYDHVARFTVPAMAANHGLAIAYANCCGSEGNLTYLGGSIIAGPHGEILAQAGSYPALLVADIPLADPGRLSTQKRDLRIVSARANLHAAG